MCKFQITESKANAHAGMPFCGMLQFVIPTSWSVFGRIDQGQQPVWGVGRLCLSVIRHAQPHMDKCNDSRLFCFQKNGRVSCMTE